MSHAHTGGQAPNQASSGRQTGAAAHTRTDHSQGTHTAASRLTSHTRHGGTRLATASDRPTRRVLPSLEDCADVPNGSRSLPEAIQTLTLDDQCCQAGV